MPERQQVHQSKRQKTYSQRQKPPTTQAHALNPSSVVKRARINPKSITAADILQLQRTIGNQEVGRFLSGIGRLPFIAQQIPVQRQKIPGENGPLQTKILVNHMTPLVQLHIEEGKEETIQLKENATDFKTNKSAPNEGNVPLPMLEIEEKKECDKHHMDSINNALDEARKWRNTASEWLDVHLGNIRKQTPQTEGGFSPVGLKVFKELHLLNQHFGINESINKKGGTLPLNAEERMYITDFERFASASYEIQKSFRNVDLSGLVFYCSTTNRKSRRGRPVPASSKPGSHEIDIYVANFDVEDDTFKTAIILHEAFHASFLDFDQDTYSDESGYPGPKPTTNPDSYTTFAAILSTKKSYRGRVNTFEDAIIEGKKSH